MAFTQNNDFNFLQESDASVVSAFGGNDVYVLDSALLSAAKRITLSDTQGINRLQLVGGLTIASSAVAADTLQLNLSNGAVVTVLGASTFMYTTGGSVPLGTGGVTQGFAQFVTGSLGVAAFPTGNMVVNGAANTMVNAVGGTTSTGGPVTLGLSERARALSVVDADLGALAVRTTPNVDGLLSDSMWNKNALTFSFNTEIPADYRTDFPSLADTLTNGWRPLNDFEKSAVRQAVQSINQVLGLTITEVVANGDLRFNAVAQTQGVAGFAFLPGRNAVDGDVFLRNNPQANYYEQGRYGNLVVIHEIGHALGLKHPFESPNPLALVFDNLSNTVMTYTDQRDLVYSPTFSGGRLAFGSPSTAYPDVLAHLDIAALQALYGANTRTALSDNTYTMGQARGGYLTLWDAGGTDTIDVSSAKFRCVVDLRGGKTSSIDLKTTDQLIGEAVAGLVAQGANFNDADAFVRGFFTRADVAPRLYNGQDNLAIVQGVVIENVNTGAGNDDVTDNAVNNRIFTGDGNDTIRLGSGGFDFINAGMGMDTVVFAEVESAVQREVQANGNWLVVGRTVAAELVGVEQLMFIDGTVTV